jgi:hypothetical protein
LKAKVPDLSLASFNSVFTDASNESIIFFPG